MSPPEDRPERLSATRQLEIEQLVFRPGREPAPAFGDFLVRAVAKLAYCRALCAKAVSLEFLLKPLDRVGRSLLDDESEILRLVRREELMRRWQTASLRPVLGLPLHWIITARNKQQLSVALHSYVVNPSSKREPDPRSCLGLFAAAESLGFGSVHGVPPHFYLESLDSGALSRVGLSPERAEHAPDVYVRVPSARELVFRGAVQREGVPIADILQVWLDVSSRPARGADQAEEIRRRVLAPIFEKRS